MVTTATLVWLGIGALFAFAMPIGLLICWRKTRKAKLTPFFAGALVFIVFALGLETLLHRVCLLSDNAVSRAINGNLWLYMLYGGFAAGVFEETGRYVAFRWLLRRDRFPERDTAVVYGIGHGGAEAMLTLGSAYAVSIVIALYLRRGNEPAALALAGGGAESLAVLRDALEQLTPGTVALAMLERACAMALHIALSCFVFLAARDRRQWTWFPFAIALHAVTDMPTALYQRGMLSLPVVELWILTVSLCALCSARTCYLEAMDP